MSDKLEVTVPAEWLNGVLYSSDPKCAFIWNLNTDCLFASQAPLPLSHTHTVRAIAN